MITLKGHVLCKLAKANKDKSGGGDSGRSSALKKLDELADTAAKPSTILAGGALGGHLVNDAFASGNLTGRQTLYHGTDASNIKSIRDLGLVPTTNENAVNTAVLRGTPQYEKSLNKAYTAKSRFDAAMYAAQTAMAKNGKNPFVDKSAKAQLLPETLKRLFSGEGIVKLNVPTWKLKTVINPEVDMPFEEWSKKVGLGGMEARLMYDKLRNGSVVFDGGLDARYVKGSDKYRGLSASELVSYIKNNPKQFAKGVGKTVGGLGLLGGAGYLADRWRKNRKIEGTEKRRWV